MKTRSNVTAIASAPLYAGKKFLYSTMIKKQLHSTIVDTKANKKRFCFFIFIAFRVLFCSLPYSFDHFVNLISVGVHGRRSWNIYVEWEPAPELDR
ncbi:hypothetical protein [Mucilaginibacter psychrotolerans]|uniref:Uncharacterized protein n=1 Tax=Mucilaginibacter psychrotolerans TaxID=1524096 RepID=A0A4Y8S6Y2_9SPHI|nr:hypothetical protein [Mucilaginibacter psychrotolerans]TFF34310.1 hypothetical protein E2R66_22510 [Mucilaginibacter psychrotolerans]